MELTVKLEDKTDISFFKKMLLQLKGVKSVEISDEGKTYSWQDIESADDFGKVMEQSRQEIENEDFVEHSQELMDSVFIKK